MDAARAAGGQGSTHGRQGFAKGVLRVLAVVLAGWCAGWGVRSGAALCGVGRRGWGIGRVPDCQRRRSASRRSKRRARMAVMRVCRAAGSILPPARGGAACSVAFLAPGEGCFVNIDS